MDDDGYGSGLSGWAWHELGRQAQQAHQEQSRTMSVLAARLRGQAPVNVGALIAENRALWQQNQALIQRIQELENSNRIWSEDFLILQNAVKDIRNALIDEGRWPAS